MSIRLMSKIIDDVVDLKGNDLLMMIILADFSNDAGICWPSVSTVARKMRLSKRQAERLLQTLRERGYLQVVGSSQYGSNIYQLTVTPSEMTVLDPDSTDSTPVIFDGMTPSEMTPPDPVRNDTQTIIIEPSNKNKRPADATDSDGDYTMDFESGVFPADEPPPSEWVPIGDHGSLGVRAAKKAAKSNARAPVLRDRVSASEAPDSSASPAAREYFRQFRRKRWSTQAQREAFESAEQQYGSSVMLEAVQWAALKGISDVASVISCAAKMSTGGSARSGPSKSCSADVPLVEQAGKFWSTQ